MVEGPALRAGKAERFRGFDSLTLRHVKEGNRMVRNMIGNHVRPKGSGSSILPPSAIRRQSGWPRSTIRDRVRPKGFGGSIPPVSATQTKEDVCQKRGHFTNDKVILTFVAQQYGMTVSMLMERDPKLKREQILVEEYEGQYWKF